MNKVMKLIVAAALLTSTAFAQEYEDLKSLYVDGKYDKLVDKAERYTKKEKTANDPLPYLYMAKGLFKISQDEKYVADEKGKAMYGNAEMESLNKYQLYVKKDKGKVYRDIADPFIAELKGQMYEETQNFYDSKNYKKAISQMKKMIKIEPNNIGCLIVSGLSEIAMKNKTEGKKQIELAVKTFKEIKSIEDYSKEDLSLMEYGLMAYTNFLVESKDFSGAKSAIALGYQYFKGEEHKEYEALYNKVVNG